MCECSSEATTLTEQAAQQRSLRHQVHAMQQQLDRYRAHYGKLESVCWNLVGDIEDLHREDVRDARQKADSLRHILSSGSGLAMAHVRGEEYREEASHAPLVPSPPREKPPLSSLSSAAASQGRDWQPPPGYPRVHGSVQLERGEAQALVDRLWTLRQWVGDLCIGVDSITMGTGRGALRQAQPQAAAFTNPHNDDAVRTSSARLHGDQIAAPTSAATTCTQRSGGGTQRLLHRLLDDLFLGFTQLQASVTDALWTTDYPPALSTPAHTRKDHEIEVERLRAINQQLRRTLRGYEQSRSQPNVRLQSVGTRASPHSSSLGFSATARRPPSGYSVSPNEGLYIAHPPR